MGGSSTVTTTKVTSGMTLFWSRANRTRHGARNGGVNWGDGSAGGWRASAGIRFVDSLGAKRTGERKPGQFEGEVVVVREVVLQLLAPAFPQVVASFEPEPARVQGSLAERQQVPP